jgi:hypothetical protein
MKHAHTIVLQPWRGTSFGERLALSMMSATLWPLRSDARMTMLINLLADQIEELAADDDQIDAIIDVLRMQLKLRR